MKIRITALVRFSRAQNWFPFQARILEIKENGEVQLRDA